VNLKSHFTKMMLALGIALTAPVSGNPNSGEATVAPSASDDTLTIQHLVPAVVSNRSSFFLPDVTNAVEVIFQSRTNTILILRQGDGTYTNIPARRGDLNRQKYRLYETIDSPDLRQGDFWLPGEFERALEEKKLKRNQEAE